ncbi:cation:proton antiporter [Botrimarina hoheduenensis]|uniref:K(+)/H(+) antiporter NhaP n=1 Tax=Botrimarina hoheduenensis TaxID=2528000 RepID=A0A5C5W7B2_9BACT|nr:sodium:proton antiporter [Botrimarina hoheduenensis]TWT46570.1 K(+)/H(+) antiporter NhaP [Botrimarina hoheduenensis]
MEPPITLTTSLYLATVLALGVTAQWLAWRTKLPAIVLLLASGFGLGLIVGPPEDYVGSEALLPMVSLAVGVILFEGGLSLHFKEVRETGAVILRLVTVGLAVTWAASTVAAHWMLGFSWPMATLVGALLTVSGPTVILPLLRQVRPVGRIGSVIKWEGIVNDPIGAVLAALVFEVVAHGFGEGLARESAFILGKTALVGLVLGGGAAWLIVQMLQRYLIPDYLQNPMVLALVVLVYALSNALQSESGLVTVTVLGLLLANQNRTTVKHVIEFKENLRVLLIAVLFIVLSSRVKIGQEEVGQIGWGGLLFVATLILVIRPAATLLATVGSDLKRNERLLLAWIHPRGIVAAAVASLFAIGLQRSDAVAPEMKAEADKLVLITFLVIVGTVLTYGLTLGPLARRLGLSRDDPQGVLFAGASTIVRQIAQALEAEGVRAMLVDTNPQNVAAARMNGLNVHYASIGSDFVVQGVDLGDIGRMIAMTPNDEVNSIAAMEFREPFGSANVYQLAPSAKTSERHRRIPDHLRGRVLFGGDVTYEKLRQRMEEGARLKATTLSEDFSFERFKQQYGDNVLLLFTFPENGKLRIGAVDQPLEPKAGVKILALVNPPAEGFHANESGILR